MSWSGDSKACLISLFQLPPSFVSFSWNFFRYDKLFPSFYIGLIAFFIFIFYQTHKNSTSILKLNHFVFIFIFVTILVIIMFFTLKMATLTIKKVNFCQYDILSINSILVTINHLLGCQKSPYLENIYELDHNYNKYKVEDQNLISK
jgi:hypothetical protein